MAIRLGFFKIIWSGLRSCLPIQILMFPHTELGAPVLELAFFVFPWDTLFVEVFEAVQKTRSTCFIRSKF